MVEEEREGIKKPEIRRIIPQELTEAWEKQRKEYLKQHPEASEKKPDAFAGVKAKEAVEEKIEKREEKEVLVQVPIEPAPLEPPARTPAEQPPPTAPAPPSLGKPKIRLIVEGEPKPELIRALQESASRDILPRRVEPSTPIQLRQPPLVTETAKHVERAEHVEESVLSKEERVERARRLWLEKERRKSEQGSFTKVKSFFASLFKR